jgi:hypothetical protein
MKMTTAGRALLEHHIPHPDLDSEDLRRRVLAIEAEAREQYEGADRRMGSLVAAVEKVLGNENIAEALVAERDYSEGNAYRPVVAAGFVSVRLKADLRAALDGEPR